MKFRRADGETIRPRLVIVDDFQTKRSAASASQCKKRLEIIPATCSAWPAPANRWPAS
jgi:hypothetical protein